MVVDQEKNDEEADFRDYDHDFDSDQDRIDENERVHQKAERLARKLE